MLELDGRRRMERWLRSQERLALDLPPLAGSDDTMFDYYVASDGEPLSSIHPSHVGPVFSKMANIYTLSTYHLSIIYHLSIYHLAS